MYGLATNLSTVTPPVGESPFSWLGEQRALDFVNTAPMVRGQRVDLIASFERLVAWCTEAELVPRASAEALLRRWSGTRPAARTLAWAHALRDELRHALESRAEKTPRLPSGLETLNAILRFPATCTEVEARHPGAFARRVHFVLAKPEHLLRPIADAAAELLCDVDPRLVRRCDNPECVLYFQDVSKNHARRWCSMSVCGNRRKVAAHQERRRIGA